MKKLKNNVRDNILKLQPYKVTRDSFLNLSGFIFLDNCENNWGSPLGKGLERYPSSSQSELKKEIASLHQLNDTQITLGNGSDELIDLLMKVTCVPGKSNVIVNEPTFGMYKIFAQINQVAVNSIKLSSKDFNYDADKILNAVNKNTRLIFICSPNNPTGNSISVEALIQLLKNFSGWVVVDEAYIDFSEQPSHLCLLSRYENLIVLQTFSKAWGLAGLRVGAAFSHPYIAAMLNKIRPPFNLSSFSQKTLSKAIRSKDKLKKLISRIKTEKQRVINLFSRYSFIEKIYPSDGNFLLLKVKDSRRLCLFLQERRILISDRSKQLNCKNHIRISIGTKQEMKKLLRELNNYK